MTLTPKNLAILEENLVANVNRIPVGRVPVLKTRQNDAETALKVQRVECLFCVS